MIEIMLIITQVLNLAVLILVVQKISKVEKSLFKIQYQANISETLKPFAGRTVQ